MVTQNFIVGLRRGDWTNLFATGEVRILKTRLLKVGADQSSEDLAKLFSISAAGMLEDSDKMILAKLKIDSNHAPHRHPLSIKSDLLIIPIVNFYNYQVVETKNHQHISELVSDFGIKLQAECLDENWNSWVFEEGIRQRIVAAQAILAKVPLNSSVLRRTGRFTWNEVVACVLRPAISFNRDDSLLIAFLRAKTRLIDLTQEYRKTEAHFISSAVEWIKISEGAESISKEKKFFNKIVKGLVKSKELSWNDPGLISDITLKLLAQIRRRHKTRFDKELTPLSISVYLRHSYEIKNGIFKAEVFKNQVTQILRLDGARAATLTCFLVASELGIEQTHNFFNLPNSTI